VDRFCRSCLRQPYRHLPIKSACPAIANTFRIWGPSLADRCFRNSWHDPLRHTSHIRANLHRATYSRSWKSQNSLSWCIGCSWPFARVILSRAGGGVARTVANAEPTYLSYHLTLRHQHYFNQLSAFSNTRRLVAGQASSLQSPRDSSSSHYVRSAAPRSRDIHLLLLDTGTDTRFPTPNTRAVISTRDLHTVNPLSSRSTTPERTPSNSSQSAVPLSSSWRPHT